MVNPWDDIPVRTEILNIRESAGSTDKDLPAFRRLSGENRPDELDRATFERYQRLAAWLYCQNPLARRACDISTEFVLGAGVQIDADKAKLSDESAEKVKALVDRFLTHPANQFDSRIAGWFTALNTVYGELFLPVFVHPDNGDLGIGYLEHYLVEDVIFDPNNRMQAIAVIQRPVSTGQKKIWWNVIRAEQGVDIPSYPEHPVFLSKDDPQALKQGDAIRRDVRVQGQIYGRNPDDYIYGGEIFYFNANVIGSGRGRSALEPVLDWLHAYDNFLFGDLRNANLQAAFVWDVEITGADLNVLQQRAKDIKANPPRPGEVNVHNEKEKWQALSPALNAASHTELGVQVKKAIGMAIGLPPHLIGAENNTNRSSSASSDVPFIRRMEQRQRLLLYVVASIVDYALDQKHYAGLLAAIQRPYPYRVVLPSLTAGEFLAQAEALLNISNALDTAINNGVTCVEDAQRIFYAYGVGENDVPQDLLKKVKSDRADGLVLDPVQQAKDALEAKKSGLNAENKDGKPRTIRAKSTSGAPGSSSRGK